MDCYACQLTQGQKDLPGGRVHRTQHWIIEHCTGPFGVGTLIVKPLRHCLHLWELTSQETAEMGPLLHEVSQVVSELLQPSQVYVCLWSHAGWQPQHLHFVVQPSWENLRNISDKPGPYLQAVMLQTGEAPIELRSSDSVRKRAESFKETGRLASRHYDLPGTNLSGSIIAHL